jgi:hypothetical protein
VFLNAILLTIPQPSTFVTFSMANTRFRLETFRPWNPFQDQVQLLLDPPDICRYPSPVSITATPPSPNPYVTVSQVPRVYSHKPERHPLPARPPVEVCLDGGARLDSLAPNHEPGVSKPAVTADQHPRASDAENSIQTRELPSTETVDPAILSDHICLGAKQIQTSENNAGIATSPDSAFADSGPSQSSRFASEDAPSQSSRRDAEDTVTPNRQHSRLARRSKARKRHTGNGSGRLPNKGPSRRKNLSFPVLRSQFSAMSVDDRLQFLSWLFEGALQRCVPTSTSTGTTSASSSNQDAVMTCGNERLNSITESVDTRNSSRKGKPWSMEEKRLLVKLREEQNLSWSEVIKLFEEKFPGRSKGSIQVYWSTTIKKKRVSWS